MHELAICQALLSQVEEIAQQNRAVRVTRIDLKIGPLSGVVPVLLQRTFLVARHGTLAEEAVLATEEMPPRVRCQGCGMESVVPTNKLLCPNCGDYHTTLLGGDELILASLELQTEDSSYEPLPASADFVEEHRDV
jgi:hydrogenase nickel incorporation protein HypA/HybF